MLSTSTVLRTAAPKHAAPYATQPKHAVGLGAHPNNASKTPYPINRGVASNVRTSSSTLDLIDPRRRSRREVDMVMRPAGEPRLNLGGFVGGIVIHVT